MSLKKIPFKNQGLRTRSMTRDTVAIFGRTNSDQQIMMRGEQVHLSRRRRRPGHVRGSMSDLFRHEPLELGEQLLFGFDVLRV